jgi:imidazoleglycerol phosphate dehydratase HisB
MSGRQAKIDRKTGETHIRLKLNIDGKGELPHSNRYSIF